MRHHNISTGNFSVVIVMIYLGLLSLLALSDCLRVPLERHKVIHNYVKVEEMIPRESMELLKRSDPSSLHQVFIAVKKNNIDTLDAILTERSDPGSERYQEWLTFDEVGSLIKNDEGYEAAVSWLGSIPDIKISWVSPHRTFIQATATIDVWEKALLTTFYSYQDHTHPKKPKRNLCSNYFIPDHLEDHISALFNTVDVPPSYKKRYARPLNEDGTEKTSLKDYVRISFGQDEVKPMGSSSAGVVTISALNSMYRVPSNEGNAQLSQSVFQTNNEYFSTNDLALFQQKYNLPQQQATAANGHSIANCPSPDSETADSISCQEGNLDIQYISGMAQNVMSIFWFESKDNNPFLQFMLDVASARFPPQSNSISWGANENSLNNAMLDNFNQAALQLAVMGVTVVVSSGDDGAPGTDNSAAQNCYCNGNSSSSSLASRWSGTPWSGRGYFPSFPATSPYVLSVGATMGLNYGNPEIACQSQLGGVITTGGGFSVHFPAPVWQRKAINGYFSGLAAGAKFSPGFNPNGRGFPDVSLIGVQYAIALAGQFYKTYGTSCSAPVMAAFVSLVNSQRVAQGKRTIGFINPTLYSLGTNGSTVGFNDITSGHNRCCANSVVNTKAVCCASGFNATKGWDPVTGFGSIYFTNFANAFGVSVTYTSAAVGLNSAASLVLTVVTIGVTIAMMSSIA